MLSIFQLLSVLYEKLYIAPGTYDYDIQKAKCVLVGHCDMYTKHLYAKYDEFFKGHNTILN